MHKDFYQLLDTLAKLKADADAGPLDGDTDLFRPSTTRQSSRAQRPHS